MVTLVDYPAIASADESPPPTFSAVPSRRIDQPPACFHGLASWPNIDLFFEALGKAVIARDGFHTAVETGARLGSDGRLTFGVRSSAAHAVVRSIANSGAKFHWTDPTGCRWAMRVVGDEPSTKRSWLARGLSVADDCRLFDPTHLAKVLSHVKQRLQQRQDRRHELSNRDRQLRARLARRERKLSLVGRGLGLLPWIVRAKEANKTLIETAVEPLATAIWGQPTANWPEDWADKVLESVAALGDVKYAEFELPKSGWGPRVVMCCRPLSSIQKVADGVIRIRLLPEFVDLTSSFN